MALRLHLSNGTLAKLPRTNLLQQVGIKPSIDLSLMGWVSIGLKRFNQSTEPRCEDDQIAGAHPAAVGVRNASGHKDRCPGPDDFHSIGVAEPQFTFQDMPCLVVRAVDVKRCGATASPFMDAERFAEGGEKTPIA
jgi:hypothetical protein